MKCFVVIFLMAILVTIHTEAQAQKNKCLDCIVNFKCTECFSPCYKVTGGVECLTCVFKNCKQCILPCLVSLIINNNCKITVNAMVFNCRLETHIILLSYLQRIRL